MAFIGLDREGHGNSLAFIGSSRGGSSETGRAMAFIGSELPPDAPRQLCPIPRGMAWTHLHRVRGSRSGCKQRGQQEQAAGGRGGGRENERGRGAGGAGRCPGCRCHRSKGGCERAPRA